MEQQLLVNEDISFDNVLVISETGESFGVMSIKKALEKARSAELDLVCISPKADTPVCKILDYKKYIYNQKQKSKEMKKNQKRNEQSEIQFNYVIQQHDIEVKINTMRKLIEKGNEIKLVLKLHGRENALIEEPINKMNNIIEQCNDFSKIKKPAKREGRDVIAIIEKI